MAKKHKPIYDVIKSEEFIEQFNSVAKRFPRALELNNMIEWQLARNPHAFERINNDYYHWITEESINPDIPTIKVLYRIITEQNKIILLSIEEIIP